MTSPELWLAFVTLLLLEIVLGIDNIVFISILAGRLPANQQARARTIGLSLALITRLLLLASLSWVIGLTEPWVTLWGHELSGRDFILLLGGLFLLGKATVELHHHLESHEQQSGGRRAATFGAVVGQIVAIDIVFSLDSVITAVGMVEQLSIMISAVVVAMAVMLLLSGPISTFVNKHPSIKVLALAFLLLIGGSLIAEGLDFHVPKGYVYGPIAFSVFVESINLAASARRERAKEPKS
ncbi:TerC family protein [Actinophytocola sp.]|uniref:TerC family protein n=1 Tax=Actinophytocola sp. TaxID=1872138 RepID=UPI002D7F38BF|nr:TerC family protein [Actinophytocola sp.]HET9143793.1 TerC family protein [Actinophytocola sp.]